MCKWIKLQVGKVYFSLFFMKYSFMLVKLSSLMNFTSVIADGAVVAGKKRCHIYYILWRVSGDNHKSEEEEEE